MYGASMAAKKGAEAVITRSLSPVSDDFPLLIYVLTKAVNNHEEFRTAINDKGELGVWDTLLPCYTVFHEEDETFSDRKSTRLNSSHFH